MVKRDRPLIIVSKGLWRDFDVKRSAGGLLPRRLAEPDVGSLGFRIRRSLLSRREFRVFCNPEPLRGRWEGSVGGVTGPQL